MDEHVKNFTYAGIGGMLSRTATAPLERLKVLYQNKKIYNSVNIPRKSKVLNVIFFCISIKINEK